MTSHDWQLLVLRTIHECGQIADSREWSLAQGVDHQELVGLLNSLQSREVCHIEDGCYA